MPVIEAIFENGVFRPTAPVDLASGAKVQISFTADDDQALEEEMLKRYPRTWGAFSPEVADELSRAVEELRKDQMEMVVKQFEEELDADDRH